MTNDLHINNQIPAGSAVPGGAGCAACKYQRRRCQPHCILAPHFPLDKKTDFQNAHKLFGVKNIINNLKKVPQLKREQAAKSIVFEANMRDKDRVHGSYKIIRDLMVGITACAEELSVVKQKIQAHKMQRRLPIGFQSCDEKQWITEYNLFKYDEGSGLGFDYDRQDGISNKRAPTHNSLGRYLDDSQEELGKDGIPNKKLKIALRVDEEEGYQSSRLC